MCKNVTVSPDRLVLKALFAALSGPNWTINAGWQSDLIPVCTFAGVGCDDLSNVVYVSCIPFRLRL